MLNNGATIKLQKDYSFAFGAVDGGVASGDGADLPLLEPPDPLGACVSLLEPPAGAGAVAPDGSSFSGRKVDVDAPLSGRVFPELPHSSSDAKNQIDNMQRIIQTPAVAMVTRVNMSPAFVPKALWPPIPPRAPVKPPPRPRWTSTKRIKNTATTNMRIPNT
jgi:hypothetical protein